MTVFTILQNFIAIRQKEPCLRRKYVDFQKMLSDTCLNIAEQLLYTKLLKLYSPSLYALGQKLQPNTGAPPYHRSFLEGTPRKKG